MYNTIREKIIKWTIAFGIWIEKVTKNIDIESWSIRQFIQTMGNIYYLLSISLHTNTNRAFPGKLMNLYNVHSCSLNIQPFGSLRVGKNSPQYFFSFQQCSRQAFLFVDDCQDSLTNDACAEARYYLTVHKKTIQKTTHHKALPRWFPVLFHYCLNKKWLVEWISKDGYFLFILSFPLWLASGIGSKHEDSFILIPSNVFVSDPWW